MQQKRKQLQKPSPSSKKTPDLFPLVFTRYSVTSPLHPQGNEDRIIAAPELGLAAVLDGVGSTSGAFASQKASRIIHRRWKQQIQHSSGNSDEHDPLKLYATLEQIIEEAHMQLQPKERGTMNTAHNDEKTETTVALAVFSRPSPGEGYTMVYAHVGDSRIYLLHEQKSLVRLTEDDGLFAKLVREHTLSKVDALRIDQAMYRSQLSEKELEYFGKRNGVTQVLGHLQPLTIHCGHISLDPGDRILLCSDGIHDNLLDREIEENLRHNASSAAARMLVKQAIKRSQMNKDQTLRPKEDDMSALIITYLHE